jgi:hypothetical protein
MTRISLIVIFSLWFCYYYAFASSGGVPSRVMQEKEKKPVKEEKVIPHQTPSAVPPKEVPKKEVKPKKLSRQEKLKIKAEEEARKKRRELIDNKKASLNNTAWEIEIVPLGGGKKTDDTVIFREGKVSLKALKEKGFSPTNYTLTIQDNGSLIWETMQTSERGKIVFIRGEISSDIKTMHGIMSYPKGGKTQDYSFMSLEKRIVE